MEICPICHEVMNWVGYVEDDEYFLYACPKCSHTKYIPVDDEDK